MREIKFRGWRKGSRQMYQWPTVLAYFELNGLSIAPSFDGTDADLELMQYTGLKDKNGRDLYEGDIVKIDLAPERDWYVTKDDFGIPCFLPAKPAFGIHLTFEQVFMRGQRDGFEIVGNIYENPELIDKPQVAG